MAKIIIQKKGFTLIELLLYVGLAAFMLLAVSLFTSQLLQARIKNQTLSRVETEGLGAMQTITQSLRNAKQVNISDNSNLQLILNDGTNVIISLNNNVINLRKNDVDYSLTSSRVVASNLKFSNLAAGGELQSVKIEFTLDYLNTENRNETSYSQSFYDTVTIRP